MRDEEQCGGHVKSTDQRPGGDAEGDGPAGAGAGGAERRAGLRQRRGRKGERERESERTQSDERAVSRAVSISFCHLLRVVFIWPGAGTGAGAGGSQPHCYHGFDPSKRAFSRKLALEFGGGGGGGGGPSSI